MTAVVQSKLGAEIDGNDIIALVKEHLGSVQAPTRVEIVNSLPRSSNGKVLKREIRDRYWGGSDRRV